MSIVTRTGDTGTTALMFNRRVPKTHARVEACGALDELNAALGLARACAPASPRQPILLDVQKKLVGLMGEIAVLPEDLWRYAEAQYARIRPEDLAGLDALAAELEAKGLDFSGWATPGTNPESAALDFARTVCRRSERAVAGIGPEVADQNELVPKFLNRLSDVLWLLAREAE
jgi:cob(I)alamin adenosyltransferase